MSWTSGAPSGQWKRQRWLPRAGRVLWEAGGTVIAMWGMCCRGMRMIHRAQRCSELGGGQDLGPPLVNVAPSLPLCPAQSAFPTAHPETSGQSLGSSWEHHLTALETQRESGQRTGAGVL